jgi:hypothetical protein
LIRIFLFCSAAKKMLGVLEVIFRADTVARRNLHVRELKILPVSIQQSLS